jgi:subtilisin family serine protease
MNERIVSSYIVLARPGMFEELVETARSFEPTEFITRKMILPEFVREVFPFGSLGLGLRAFPRFRMIAGIFPREVVEDMAEWRCVERVFSDELMWIQQFPTVPPEGVYELKRRIRKGLTFTTTYWTKKLVGADVANSKGFRGRGITVAVIDSGARRTHEQIRGRVRCESTLKGQYIDDNGHGTWCMTCIGGRSSVDERMTRMVGKEVICEGMAPECDLISIKALGYVVGFGPTSAIVEAVHVALDLGADVISMSLGGPLQGSRPEDDPQFYVFEEVVKAGVIPVVAAGNEGPSEGTVCSPGVLPNTLGVGAYDPMTGEVAPFSSRGPTPWGDTGVDCVAPGVNIHSGCVAVCDFAGDHIESRYSPLSGTSMATPHASGLVALMREAIARRAPWMKWDFYRTIDMLKKTATEPKSNDYGWGPITWQRFEEYCETELGIRI